MRISKLKILLVCILLGLTFASFASAALVNCGRNDQLPSNFSSLSQEEQAAAIKKNQCEISDLILLIVGIINFLLSWAYLVAILFIVWSGWNMVIAGGNEEAISAAKTGLSNAVIGFFLIMISFVLLNFVVSIFTEDGMPSAGALLKAFDLLP